MLRQIVMKAVFVLISLTGQDSVPAEDTFLHSQPSYAKWGRLAMEETSKAYEHSSIVDYKYEGRKQLPDGNAEESFFLWLRQDGREFGVRVRIKVEANSDRLIGISLNESNAR